MIDIVEDKDVKSRIITDEKGKRHRTYSERKCCNPGCSHPNETYIDPATGVAAWYKVKTIVKGEKVWDGKSYYCNEHEHKMRKQIRKGTLKPNSNTAKGDRVERAFEKIGYRNCNKERDNYNFPYDLYDPVRRLKIQVRSVEIKLWTKKWIKVDNTEGTKVYSGYFINLDMKRNYDSLFAVCVTKDYLDIDSIYIIPENRLPTALGLYIYKENVESHLPIKSRYEDCRDEELLQKVRKVYREILIEDGMIQP